MKINHKVIFHVDNIQYLQLPDLMYNFISKKHAKIQNIILKKSVLIK